MLSAQISLRTQIENMTKLISDKGQQGCPRPSEQGRGSQIVGALCSGSLEQEGHPDRSWGQTACRYWISKVGRERGQDLA